MANSAHQNSTVQVTLAPFWKRLFAWVYDLLGGLAVFILALAIGLLVAWAVTYPWIEDGHSVSDSLNSNPLWFLFLLTSVQYYYAWCWVKGGQTVGMRAWRLKICKPDGQHLNWKEAYIRTFASLGGVSTIWSIFDKEKRGLQDIAINSRVILLPKGYEKEQYGKEDKPLI